MAMIQEKAKRLLWLRCCVTSLVFFLAVMASISGTESVRFDFSTLTRGNLKLLGDAHLNNGSIRLSRDLPVPNSGAGRALFADPVRLRHPFTGAVLPFSTFFTFSIVNLNPSSIGGGLAFLITANDSDIGDPGGFLGLIKPSAVDSAVFAVEFDTIMDEEFEDINDNHVGVDIDSMVSAQVADLDTANINLKSGKRINVWIEYKLPGVLQIFVSYSASQPSNPVLAFPIDLAHFVDEFMFLGFSGSTQGSTEIHIVELWNFSSHYETTTPSSALPPRAGPASIISPDIFGPPPPDTIAPIDSVSALQLTSACHRNKLCRQGPAAVVGVATAATFFIALFAILGVIASYRRGKSGNKLDSMASAVKFVKIPREFSYRELAIATRDFNLTRIIGHGAFGTVYKGIIPTTGAIMAVKRCIKSGKCSGHVASQHRAEFLSELSIISSLRHRNLVRLQGWCQEKGEVLLVYDYMRNGSLDKALFDPSHAALPWRLRRKILAGVASALAYLHYECEQLVIHRDVKSSNVMLDEDFHPRLGDFGLARQIDHDRSPDATMAAGTMGYLAPEYILTGRASDKTDVYSFGALVLEVVSGRRPIDDQRRGSLVEWVWSLHGDGRLLDAIDPRLKGEFEETELRKVLLVGLGCSSPDPATRPGMRSVVQMFGDEAEPPHVPPLKPSMSLCSNNHHLLLSLQDSLSDYNAITALSLSSSSSSSPLTCICRESDWVDGTGGPSHRQ